jgi:hypothetical protein
MNRLQTPKLGKRARPWLITLAQAAGINASRLLSKRCPTCRKLPEVCIIQEGNSLDWIAAARCKCRQVQTKWNPMLSYYFRPDRLEVNKMTQLVKVATAWFDGKSGTI